jgi:replication factor C subunit 2/4
VAESEGVPCSDDGLEAIIFTAEGDMRNALNNLQSTYAGFGIVSEATVFKVCDQPHPLTVREVVRCASVGDVDGGVRNLMSLLNEGYAAIDIIGTIFRVARTFDMPESKQLEFIKHIGYTHMRIAEGVGSHLQLQGLVARLCTVSHKAAAAGAP